MLCLLFLAAVHAPPRGVAGQSAAPGRGGPATGERRSPPADDKKSNPEGVRLPADAVIVICEQAADALRMIPDAIVLPPRRYQELLDEITRLREQLADRKGTPPSRCQIRGHIEGNLALLQLQFDLVTDRRDSVVALACGQGVATAATLDGHTPLFRPDREGFTLQVERAGDHQLNLDLTVPLAPRAAGQALELTLPRAAVTTVELDVPAGVKDVRAGGRPVADTLLTLKNNHLSGGLSSAERRLELAWSDPRPSGGAPLLVADGRIVVHVDGGAVSTEADLSLRAEAGQATAWQLLVPRGAHVHVSRPDEGRLDGPIQVADQPGGSLRTIRLREPNGGPLNVHVSATGPALRAGHTATVGPFAALGAARQAGTVLVSNNVPELHLEYRTRAPLRRQLPPADEDRHVASFRYGAIAGPDGAATVTPGRSPWLGPWLDLEAQAVGGQVAAEVSHVLELVPDDRGGLVWHSTTTILATPRWADVEDLKVLLPAGWERLDEGAPPATADLPERVGVLKLTRAAVDAPLRAVKLTLEGRYRRVHTAEGQARLALPRPQGAVDQGGEITVRVGKGMELLTPANVPPSLEAGKQGPHEQTWRSRGLPEAMTVTWRPYVPEVRLQSIADIELSPERGDVWRHEVRFRLPDAPPDSMTLHVPPGVRDLRVRGGRLRDQTGSRRVVELERPAASELRLVLTYSFSLPTPRLAPSERPFTLPLITPEPGGQGDVRVRLWCRPGQWPSLAEPTAWREQPVEAVKERESLPVLVAAAIRTDVPLKLRWQEPRPADTVLAERVVVRVQLSEGGAQSYVVRYRLRRLATTSLQVELPALVSLVDLRVALDHHPVTPQVIEDAGPAGSAGRVATLHLGPDLVGPASELELSYHLPVGRAASTSWPGGVLTAELLPPVLRGSSGDVPAYWHVTVPASWVVLGPESGPGVEREWAWRGRLAGLRLRPLGGVEDSGADEAGPPPDVLCWRNGAEGLTLTCVPQQTWLLACSLATLIVGLVLLGGKPRRGVARLRLGTGVLVLLTVAVAGLFRPALLTAVVYGCQPGTVVLAAVLLLQWLLQERYRRQVFFLPSFSRQSPGSSHARAGVANRAAAEPSTMDHLPRAPGSSVVP
jgi:hypothetical protein